MAQPPSASTQTLSHYLLGKKLGEGAMGEVWLARDKLLDREVAVKILHAGAGNERLVKDFLREARAAARLNHPNTVTIHQIGKDRDRVFIAMEYVEAGSLSDELREKGALPWREATQAIRDAAAGLQAAHELGMVHRDVKPSNLMRSARGLVKVVDFGLAKARDGSTDVTQTQPGTILGSPAYMAPEQCRGEPADARSDLYSLICSYYQLLTRQLPFPADQATVAMYQHCHAPFPNARDKGFMLPDGVCRILEWGSRKDPAERYQSAAELIADLDAVLHTPEVSHTFDGKTPAIGAGAAPRVSLGSVMRGHGVVGKTAWGAAAAMLAFLAFAVLRHPTVPPNAPVSPAVVASTQRAPSLADRYAADRAAIGATTTDGVKDKTAAAHKTPTPAPPAIAPATGAGVVDLMRLIDPKRDKFEGDWRLDAGTLSTPGGDAARLQIPFAPSGEYEWTVVAERMEEQGHGLVLGFVTSAGQSTLIMDGFGRTASGLELVGDAKGNENPTTYRQRILPIHQTVTIVLKVLRDRVTASYDGKTFIDWSGDEQRLSVNPRWKVPKTTQLFIGAQAPMRITRMSVKALNSSVAMSQHSVDGHSVVNLLPVIDPFADAVAGTWHVDGGKLVVDSEPRARLSIRLPYIPADAEEYDFHVGFVLGQHASELRGLAYSGGKRFDFTISTAGIYGLENAVGKEGTAARNTTTGRAGAGFARVPRHDFVIRVRNQNGVQVCLDGRRVIEHAAADLGEDVTRKRPDNTLGLNIVGGDVAFDTIEVMEVKGRGNPLRPASAVPAPAASAPAGADFHRRTPGLVGGFTTDGDLQSAYITPGAHRLVFFTHDINPHAVHLIDVATANNRFLRFTETNGGFLLPGDKRVLLEAGGKWRVVDAETGDDLLILGEGTGGNAAVSGDGSRMLAFATGAADNPSLYYLNSGEKIATLKDHGTRNPRAFSPAGDIFAAPAGDHQLHVWNANTGNELWHAAVDDIGQLTFSSSGTRLLRRSNRGGGGVDLFNSDTGELLGKWGGWAGRCLDAAMSEDGSRLVAACDDPATGLRLFTLKGEQHSVAGTLADGWPSGLKDIGPVNVVKFSPDDRRVLAGCRDGKLRLFDVQSGSMLAEFDHGGEVLVAGFSSDGRYAVSGSDTSVRVWKLPDSSLHAEVPPGT